MRFPAVKQILEPLECTGSAYERGNIQGQALKKQIQLSLNAFFQSEPVLMLKSSWLPSKLSIKHLENQSKRLLQNSFRRYAPESWEQLQGLASGADVQVESLLLMTGIELLLSKPNLLWGSGSLLMIPPRFSASEEPILIKNMDYPYFLKHFNLIRKTNSPDKLSSIDFSLQTSVGAHAGMNTAGVAMAFNYCTAPIQAHSSHIPISIKMQQALQHCESAQETVRFFELGQQEGCGIVGVQDSSGDMYLIEILSNKVFSKKIRDKLLIATNHYQLSELSTSNSSVGAYYHFRHLKELTGQRILESSEQRFDRLNELTGTRIQFHQNDLLHYLCDHGSTHVPSDGTLCRHGDYFETACSLMLRPNHRQISVAQGNPCEVPYQVYQWL
jgi:isopenicillin-N N-acyltransferase-like protein